MNPGDFSFITDPLRREILTYDYACVTQEGWTALKNHDPKKSFMFETQGEIWDEMRRVMWDGHSGCSMAMSLRELESIAKKGWKKYVSGS
jgi:hypothetical protein